jgi:phage shock protein A
MMAQSILGRIGQLVRANVNALLDSAEDPELMLEQLVRDYSSNVREVEAAVAQTIGNLRLLEEDQREAQDAAQEWAEKARAASRKADELRTSGQDSEADRFDNLARIALRRQISYEDQAKTLEEQVSQQRDLTDKLKSGLEQLRLKREELVRKRDELTGRSRVARAQIKVQQAVQDVSAMNPTSELRRFEDRVRHEEALARGMEEVATSSIDEQFAALDADEDEQEVEARLAQLKSGQDRRALSGR